MYYHPSRFTKFATYCILRISTGNWNITMAMVLLVMQPASERCSFSGVQLTRNLHARVALALPLDTIFAFGCAAVVLSLVHHPMHPSCQITTSCVMSEEIAAPNKGYRIFFTHSPVRNLAIAPELKRDLFQNMKIHPFSPSYFIRENEPYDNLNCMNPVTIWIT